MNTFDKRLEQMRRNPKNVRFKSLCIVCEHYFGKARQGGTSHRIYETPWMDVRTADIQNNHGKAKPYQVKQVLTAIGVMNEQRRKHR